MKISIASGKGGTGKTLVATNLALSIDNQPVQILDCDVEEPNAHIFLKGDLIDEQRVYTQIPKVNENQCQSCGKCADLCVFNAMALFDKTLLCFDDLCHSCGACWQLCPEQALEPFDKEIGTVKKTKINDLTLVTGTLKIGTHISPPIIKAVKEQCITGINIIDGPPGSSCPVMETVSDTDYCVLVTEPTPFGLNDLTLAVEMLRSLAVPCGVVINRDGADSAMIEKFCQHNNLEILMRIPLDIKIAQSYSQGIPIVQNSGEWQRKFNQLHQRILKEVQACKN
ncbi:ATP-binding protein [Peptococcaceae bacterium 1198_IL3148]